VVKGASHELKKDIIGNDGSVTGDLGRCAGRLDSGSKYSNRKQPRWSRDCHIVPKFFRWVNTKGSRDIYLANGWPFLGLVAGMRGIFGIGSGFHALIHNPRICLENEVQQILTSSV
jgi:hypothetical protein